MRGNPLGQLGLILVVFLALGLPVWRLTRPAQAAPVVAPTQTNPGESPGMQTGATELKVTAEFAPAATEFSLSYLDQTILQGKEQNRVDEGWRVQLPPEGADLILHAVWPGVTNGGMAAVRVVVTFPDGRTVDKSFWSPGGAPLDTVLSLPGLK